METFWFVFKENLFEKILNNIVVNINCDFFFFFTGKCFEYQVIYVTVHWSILSIHKAMNTTLLPIVNIILVMLHVQWYQLHSGNIKINRV